MPRQQCTSYGGRSGFSLVEMLVVLVIISILVAGIVQVGRVVYMNAKIRTTENNIKILCDALAKYQAAMDKKDGQFYFPIAPTVAGFSVPNGLIAALDYHFLIVNQIGTAVTAPQQGNHDTYTWKDSQALDNVTINDPFLYARSTIEFIYCVLNDVPASREVMERLPQNAAVNDDGDSATVANRPVQFIEVLDAWGHPLWYQSVGAGNFPVIRSAGPDAAFATADDIVSTDF